MSESEAGRGRRSKEEGRVRTHDSGKKRLRVHACVCMHVRMCVCRRAQRRMRALTRTKYSMMVLEGYVSIEYITTALTAPDREWGGSRGQK